MIDAVERLDALKAELQAHRRVLVEHEAQMARELALTREALLRQEGALEGVRLVEIRLGVLLAPADNIDDGVDGE